MTTSPHNEIELCKRLVFLIIMATDANGNQAVRIGTAMPGSTMTLDPPASTVLYLAHTDIIFHPCDNARPPCPAVLVFNDLQKLVTRLFPPSPLGGVGFIRECL
jgi:hypothetical protein